jgi:mono/diheme cytochrome c family protein
MKGFIIGLIIGLFIVPVAVLIVMASGAWNVGATAGPGALETMLASWTVDRSVAVHAPTGNNPLAGQPQAVDQGLHHFRDMCVRCHGGPAGIKRDEFAEGLDPPPPDLDDGSPDKTDGQLFWIVKHGIRMTGMPALAPTHSDDDIWRIVSALRSLDHLTPDQLAILKQPPPAEQAQPAPAKQELAPPAKPEQAAPAKPEQAAPPKEEQAVPANQEPAAPAAQEHSQPPQ